MNNYPPLATANEDNGCFSVIIYTPQKINLDDFFTCHGWIPGRHFFTSCSGLALVHTAQKDGN